MAAMASDTVMSDRIYAFLLGLGSGFVAAWVMANNGSSEAWADLEPEHGGKPDWSLAEGPADPLTERAVPASGRRAPRSDADADLDAYQRAFGEHW